MRGKPAAASGFRIVLAATGITVLLLIGAFGAIGMLMKVRGPQEPIASKLDPAPPLVAEAPPPPVVTPEPEQVAVASEPLIIPPPEPVPFATQDQLEKEVAALPPEEIASDPEPETTASIPETAEPEEQEAKPEPVVVPRKRAAPRQAPPRQRVVRRTYQKKAEPQSTNPFMQLFGIKQYR